ncbi:MAG: hypothetical protein ABI700_12875 [Chloroflexota bacterium]
MTDLYFRCEWLVQPLKTSFRGTGGALMSIYDIVTEHDCQLIIGSYTTWKVRADNCHIIPFIIRVPSMERLQECLDALKDYMQFSNFQPASEEDFIGDPHLFALSAGTTDIIDVIESMGKHNENILKNKC